MHRKKFLKTTIVTYISLSLLLIIWELTVYFTNVSSIIIVRPSEIYPVIFESSSIFIKEVLFTFGEAFGGWFIGSFLGFSVATSVFSFKLFSKVIVTIAVLINAIPLVALSAITSGFMGTGQESKMLIVSIICFFPMLVTVLTAFQGVSKDHNNLFATFSTNPFQKFIKLTLPHSLPFIMITLKVNSVLAISTAIVSEFFGAHGGIGQFILARKGFYDLPMVWGAIFYIVIIGAVFYMFLSVIQKKFIKW